MNEGRVAITGLGVLSPLGCGLSENIEKLKSGHSGFSPITRFNSEGFENYQVGEVKDFDVRSYFSTPKAIKTTDWIMQMSVAAAAMALNDTGLDLGNSNLEPAGVLMGTGISDQQPEVISRAIGYDPDLRSVKDVAYFSHRILDGLPPLWLLMKLPNMVSAHIGIQFGLRGPNNTVTNDWISGSQAIGEAYRVIRNGEAPLMVAGGSDSGLFPQIFLGFEKAGLLDDQIDDRFVIGEGAGCLILEEMDHAIRRNAQIYGEIVGFSCGYSSADDTCGKILGNTIDSVLEQTGWTSSEIDIIHCASTRTPSHKNIEEAALSRLLADNQQTKLVEFKSLIGHTLAASGAVESVLALISSFDKREEVKLLSYNIGLMGQTVTLGYSMESQPR